MPARLRIGVAGAGIGGLAAAIALTRGGHDVQVFDQFEVPRPLGSGLVIQPVGQRVMDWLGVGARARSLGTPIRQLHGTEALTGARTLDVRYDAGGADLIGLGIHRATLFQILLDGATALQIPLHAGHTVTGRETGRLLFQGGQTSAPFDLIVDALGTHSPLSPLRAQILPYGALWTTLRWPAGTDMPRDRLSQRYVAARKMVGVLPVGRLPGETDERAAFFWSLRHDALPAWQDAGLTDWQDDMLSLWPALAPFVAQITDPAQMTMARYAHGTLRRPWSPGLAHIGDAAHRASPQLGQGANMALLDAASLASALSTVNPGAPALDDALARYAHDRRLHLRLYQTLSRFLTPQYQSDSQTLAVMRDHLVAPMGRIPLVAQLLGRIASGTLVSPFTLSGLDIRPPWAAA